MASHNETLRTNSFTPPQSFRPSAPSDPKASALSFFFFFSFSFLFLILFSTWFSFWVPAFANNLTPFFYYHFVLFNQDSETKNKDLFPTYPSKLS